MRCFQYAKASSAGLLAVGLLCGAAAGQEPRNEASAEAAVQPSQPPAPGPALPGANDATPTPDAKNDNVDLSTPQRDQGTAPIDTAPKGTVQNDANTNRTLNPSQPGNDPANANNRGNVDDNRGNLPGTATNRYNTANVGITFNSTTGGALVINGIANQGYFHGTGLQRGDRIVSAGGRQFNNPSNFYGWLGTVRPGAPIPIVVLRGGQQTTVYWTPTAEFVQQYTQSVPSGAANFFGIHVDNTIQDAVVVAQVDPNSPADHAGIRMHDRVVAVNDREVRSPGEFADAAASMPQGQIATLAIARTMSVQLDPSIQGTPVQQRTSYPPVPAASAVPTTTPQPAVVVQPQRSRVTVPAPRRGFFRRN